MRKKLMAGGCALALALCPMAGMGESLSGGTVIIKNPDNSTVSQSLNSATANATLGIALANARGTLRVKITGLTASGAVLSVYSSRDGGLTYDPKKVIINSEYVPTISADGPVDVDVAGITNMEFVVTTTGTGTITISYNESAAVGFVSDPNNMPFGGNQVMTLGTTYPAGRTLQIDCPSAGGAVTATLADGQTEIWNVGSSTVSQTVPLAVTKVTSGPSGCTFTELY